MQHLMGIGTLTSARVFPRMRRAQFSWADGPPGKASSWKRGWTVAFDFTSEDEAEAFAELAGHLIEQDRGAA